MLGKCTVIVYLSHLIYDSGELLMRSLSQTWVLARERVELDLGEQHLIHHLQLPTIRLKNVIHSADSGSILTVPRERGYVRYVRSR